MSECCAFEKKPLIIFELSEFNEDLLETAAKQYQLKNILALLSYPKTQISPQTITHHHDAAKSPAARWESLHTGQEPTVHGIHRLGPHYAPSRSLPYWESLLNAQHSVGLWGVINAKKPTKPQAKFFFPDLWQSKESANPKYLTNFITLPRYVTKHHPSIIQDSLFKTLLKFISFIKNSGMGKQITLELIRLVYQAIRSPSPSVLFVCFYDLISCMLFTAELKKTPVHLSIFFANSLAYLQHYYWRQGKWVTTPALLHGLKIIDRMIGMLRQFEQTHHIILINGLTQENQFYQPEQIVYKIKDPSQFFRYMALAPVKVDALCPDNGIVYFNHASDCKKAIALLNETTLNNNSIFKATPLEHFPEALHYRIVLNTATNKEDYFVFNQIEFRFFKYFKAIHNLTGSHDMNGTLFSKGVDFPAEIPPEKFGQYILNYYN